MATKQKSPERREDLFPRQLTSMPEGFYSGDSPNPNLRDLIIKWRKATNEYTELPRTKVQAVSVDRANSLYNLHKYWSKKGYEGIAHYMLAFTNSGDIILDPFCGSGGVGVVALENGRVPILIDASPAATFISKG